MAPADTSRTVERLIADLAGRSDADIAMIVGLLDPVERDRVEALLRLRVRPPATGQAPFDTVSPWLTDLVRTDGVLTSRAADALRGCIGRVAAEASGERSDVPRSPSLIGRLGSGARTFL